MEDLLDKKKRIYKETGMKLHPLNQIINQLNRIKHKKSKIKVGKRNFLVNIILSLLIMFLVPTMTYATYYVSQILYEKIQNANYSKEEMIELEQNLKGTEFKDEDIDNLNELQVNTDGLTYGPDVLGADLIEVISVEGDIGYVYREDLESTEAESLDESIHQGNTKNITVYTNDGKTAIGTFILSDGKELQ